MIAPSFRSIDLCPDNEVDSNGMHADVHIQEIRDLEDDDTPLTLNKTRPTADTEEFFARVPRPARVPGDKKKRMKCKACVYVPCYF